MLTTPRCSRWVVVRTTVSTGAGGQVVAEPVVRPVDVARCRGDRAGGRARGDAEHREDVGDAGADRHDEVVAPLVGDERQLVRRCRHGSSPHDRGVPPPAVSAMNNSHGYGGPDRCEGRRGGSAMTVAARRGAREQAPQVPSGRIVLQPPPEITPSDGASGLLLQAVPMVGSLGTIGFVAMSQSGPRAWFTAGMFLLASVGFVLASGVRQRQQHTAGVLAARREYLAYLAEVRGTIRDAAGRQREAALWDYPDPAALPTIAAEGTRVWERTVSDADFLQVRMGTTSQPLCLTLEPPETPPLAQLDPVAASALHRLLSTHQVQPGLPASAALRAWAHVEVTGDADPARALARSIVLSAAMQHAPGGPRRGRAGVPRVPLGVGVAQVAAARTEPARTRRRRAGAAGR